jgi:hypothetical protein
MIMAGYAGVAKKKKENNNTVGMQKQRPAKLSDNKLMDNNL